MGLWGDYKDRLRLSTSGWVGYGSPGGDAVVASHTISIALLRYALLLRLCITGQ